MQLTQTQVCELKRHYNILLNNIHKYKNYNKKNILTVLKELRK